MRIMIDIVSSAVGLQGSAKSAATPLKPDTSVSGFASSMLDVIRDAEKVAVGGIQGQVPMQDVVMKVMEAERTFAAAMAVRDKAVSAYLELSRMQI
jgi:flagellar hook-basal body complex protein FliE